MKQDIKESVRRAYDFRCGYCGVREEEAGSELEVDHFQPRSTGGGDDLENLVYCCTTCNRFKSDYWPAND
ncbi:MAG: HNH endonuclease signature motif containing protein, partial [Acidobacteriota bacterium]